VWPWSKVLRWHEHTKDIEYRRHLSVAQLHHTFIRANSRAGSSTPSVVDLLPDFARPEGLRAAGARHVWDESVVKAFQLALKLGVASNGLMNALGLANLRAAGWRG